MSHEYRLLLDPALTKGRIWLGQFSSSVLAWWVLFTRITFAKCHVRSYAVAGDSKRRPRLRYPSPRDSFVLVYLRTPGRQAGKWVGRRRAFQSLMGVCSLMAAGGQWLLFLLLLNKLILPFLLPHLCDGSSVTDGLRFIN